MGQGIMALSDTVKESLRDAQEDLRNALAAAARTEKPFVSKHICLLYTSPSPRDVEESRMPSSA